jgi:AraC-like DNA-binding protein
MADILFRKVMGHTILDEIHSVRLDRVKALLKQGNMAFSALPDFCGYSSLDVLRRVFKARTGMSLKAFVNA